jgi:hypothetical protein
MRDNDSLILEGAYLEILEESRKERYLEMFKGIPERFASFSGKIGIYGKSAEDWKQQAIDRIQQEIEWAIENLKREDRILWYLRQIKIGLYLETDEILETLRKLWKEMRSKDEEKNQRIMDEYNKLVNSLPTAVRKSVAFKQFSPIPSADNISEYGNKLVNFLWHFLSMHISEIDNFRFENQDYEDILNKFIEIEKKWKEKQKSWIDITNELKEGRISPVVVFDDGFRWFNLNRPQCEQEGKAMGHCGNCGGRSDDTILSLRKLKQEGGRMYARPSLTFILHDNGQLGEMKGRGNNKPNEKYHPYILRLLAQKNLIKGIEGGGYLPENNFSLGDLSEDGLEAIFNARPDLQINDRTSLRRVVEHFISKDKELPDNFINLQTNNGEWFLPADIAYDYSKFLMSKGKEIPHILYLIIGRDKNYSFAIAEKLTDNEVFDLPQVILNGVSKDENNSYDLALKFLNAQKNVPQELTQAFQRNDLLVRLFAENLIERNIDVPLDFIFLISGKSASAANFANFLTKMGIDVPDVISKGISINTFNSVNHASVLIKNKRKIPINIIYSISQDPESSRAIAEYMLENDYGKIPESILQGIMKSDETINKFVYFLKTQSKELPPVLKTFVNLHSKDYINK